MDYSKFNEIINNGESKNVDFKIHCDAFSSPNISSKAELAKDICAMANNGNIASYIIVGVSDDRHRYKSIANPNLTDDNLQVFCSQSIFPPPKVKLSRKQWNQANSRFKDVEFIIIQVGPQRRQAFRITQNFIGSEGKIYHRKNEVWIRRGATSDLATAEEIHDLVEGKSPIEETESIQVKKEKEEFKKLSLNNKMKFINGFIEAFFVKDVKYRKIKDVNIRQEAAYRRLLSRDIFYKILEKSVIFVSIYPSIETLTKSDMSYGWSSLMFNRNLVEKKDIPKAVLKKIGNDKFAIRRLAIVPVLSGVPSRRVQSAVRSGHWSGIHLHFFISGLDPSYKSLKEELYPSSSELLILDKIDSITGLEENLLLAMKDIELNTDTIISPNPS